MSPPECPSLPTPGSGDWYGNSPSVDRIGYRPREAVVDRGRSERVFGALLVVIAVLAGFAPALAAPATAAPAASSGQPNGPKPMASPVSSHQQVAFPSRAPQPGRPAPKGDDFDPSKATLVEQRPTTDLYLNADATE